VIGLCASSPTIAPMRLAGTWRIDAAASRIAFTVRHLGVLKVHGVFTDVEGQVEVDDHGDLQASAIARAASLDTGHARRDRDVTTRFLESAAYPVLSFTTQGGSRLDAGTAPGVLTIKDVAQPVDVSITVPEEGDVERLRIVATACIDRRAFGVVASGPVDWGGFVVGRRVQISADLTLASEE
jgi:polyisoprenoid-binding protein YceI